MVAGREDERLQPVLEPVASLGLPPDDRAERCDDQLLGPDLGDAGLPEPQPFDIRGGDTLEAQIAGRGGFLTIYDCGDQPLASGIDDTSAGVVNNEIITKLSPTGTICIFARTTTDLVFDDTGHLRPQ